MEQPIATIFRHTNGLYRAWCNGHVVGAHGGSTPWQQRTAALLQDQLVYFGYKIEYDAKLRAEWGLKTA